MPASPSLLLRRGARQLALFFCVFLSFTVALEAEYEFATRTELVICGKKGSVALGLTGEKMEKAARSALGISNKKVKITGALQTVVCPAGSLWGVLVSVHNEPSSDPSASVVASGQVDKANESSFLFTLEEALREDGVEGVTAQDMEISSLGYIVDWTSDSLPTTTSDLAASSNPDVVKIGSLEVYWPWWCWLLFALVFLFVMVPASVYCFMKIREKEVAQERERSR
jgi:hypothetical protein